MIVDKYMRHKITALALGIITITSWWCAFQYAEASQLYNSGATVTPVIRWAEPILDHRMMGTVFCFFIVFVVAIGCIWAYLGTVFISFCKTKYVSSNCLNKIIFLSTGARDLIARARQCGVDVTPNSCTFSTDVLERVSMHSLSRLVFQLLMAQIDDVVYTARFALRGDETVFLAIARQLQRLHPNDAKKFVSLMRNYHELFGESINAALEYLKLQRQVDDLRERQKQHQMNYSQVLSAIEDKTTQLVPTKTAGARITTQQDTALEPAT